MSAVSAAATAGRTASRVGTAARVGTASTAPAPAPVPGSGTTPLRASPPRPRLTLVPHAPARVARTPFVLLVCGLLAGGLLALLLLNTVLAQNAFALHDLEQRSAWLDARQAALSRQVAEEAAPQRLAQRAAKMGMVPSDSPAFLRVADGRVLGSPTAGRAGAPSLGTSGSSGRAPTLLSPPVSPLVPPEQQIDLLAPPSAGNAGVAATAGASAKAAAQKAAAQKAAAQKVGTGAGTGKVATSKAATSKAASSPSERKSSRAPRPGAEKRR